MNEKNKDHTYVTVYDLTLHKSYYNNGFFNLGVDVDRFVRRDDGPIQIRLGDSDEVLVGRVDRNANQNGTPRIHVGAELVEWFKRHYSLREVVQVVVVAPDQLMIRKLG